MLSAQGVVQRSYDHRHSAITSDDEADSPPSSARGGKAAPRRRPASPPVVHRRKAPSGTPQFALPHHQTEDSHHVPHNHEDKLEDAHPAQSHVQARAEFREPEEFHGKALLSTEGLTSKNATEADGEVGFKILGRETFFDVEKAVNRNYAIQEEQDLRMVFESLDTRERGAVDAEDVAKILLMLGYVSKAGEADDMIWEVDDLSAGQLDWAAIKRMYFRLRASNDVREPRALFTLIEFMMFDADNSGTIEPDEALNLFRRRYAKELLMKTANVFFDGGQGAQSISFQEFVVKDRQLNQLRPVVAPEIASVKPADRNMSYTGVTRTTHSMVTRMLAAPHFEFVPAARTMKRSGLLRSSGVGKSKSVSSTIYSHFGLKSGE